MPEHDKTSKKLDDAVEKTFPASDPVNVGTPTGTEPSGKPVDRAPPLIFPAQGGTFEKPLLRLPS